MENGTLKAGDTIYLKRHRRRTRHHPPVRRTLGSAQRLPANWVNRTPSGGRTMGKNTPSPASRSRSSKNSILPAKVRRGDQWQRALGKRDGKNAVGATQRALGAVGRRMRRHCFLTMRGLDLLPRVLSHSANDKAETGPMARHIHVCMIDSRHADSRPGVGEGWPEILTGLRHLHRPRKKRTTFGMPVPSRAYTQGPGVPSEAPIFSLITGEYAGSVSTALTAHLRTLPMGKIPNLPPPRPRSSAEVLGGVTAGGAVSS